jgi:hypothetical protein
MKGLFFVVLLALLAAGVVFAETPQRVATDAEILLGREQDRSASNHLFLEESVLGSFENRIKLNEYRTRFNAISGRIYVVKNQITVALNVREPNIGTVTNLRQQLTNLVNEHDQLITEFRQWTTSLR